MSRAQRAFNRKYANVWGQRIKDWVPRITYWGLRIKDCELRIEYCWLRTEESTFCGCSFFHPLKILTNWKNPPNLVRSFEQVFARLGGWFSEDCTFSVFCVLKNLIVLSSKGGGSKEGEVKASLHIKADVEWKTACLSWVIKSWASGCLPPRVQRMQRWFLGISMWRVWWWWFYSFHNILTYQY